MADPRDGISAVSDRLDGSRLSLSLEIKPGTPQNRFPQRRVWKRGAERAGKSCLSVRAPPPAEMEDNVFYKTGIGGGGGELDPSGFSVDLGS